MNVEHAKEIALAIRFKEYLLLRDVSSRRAILGECLYLLAPLPGKETLVGWFQNLRMINDQLDASDRKEFIKADACWDELILVHSRIPQLQSLMRAFMTSQS